MVRTSGKVPYANDFTSQSLYFHGTHDALLRFFRLLTIQGDQIYQGDCEQDSHELRHRINTATIYPLAGDFHFAIDLHIWNIHHTDLMQRLLDFSDAKTTLAFPDEHSVKPFDYILLHAQKKHAVEVVEDETSQGIYLHSPQSLRKTILGQP